MNFEITLSGLQFAISILHRHFQNFRIFRLYINYDWSSKGLYYGVFRLGKTISKRWG